jgi:MFS family permease
MTPKALWALAITSVAVFMVTLDNLVVTTAIPVIRQDLHAGLSGLQWTVNAYTLTFAVLLMTGAALGDRFGRRQLLAIGVAIFTAASAGAALAPSDRCARRRSRAARVWQRNRAAVDTHGALRRGALSRCRRSRTRAGPCCRARSS